MKTNKGLLILPFLLFGSIVEITISCKKDVIIEPPKSGVVSGNISVIEDWMIVNRPADLINNLDTNIQIIEYLEPIGISTTIAITKPSDVYDCSLLVDSIISSKTGDYKMNVANGTYSVFVRNGNTFSNAYLQKCGTKKAKTISIKGDSITVFDAIIDHRTENVESKNDNFINK